MRRTRSMLLSLGALFAVVLAPCAATALEYEQTWCGPSGGHGGGRFNDNGLIVYSDGSTSRITEVRVWSGKYIDAVQLVNSGAQSVKRGGAGGVLSVFRLGSDERIVAIGGKYGDYVDHLFIRTSKGRSHEWGGPGGSADFYYSVPRGSWIIGFMGRSGSYIDAIGVEIVTPH